MDFIRSDDRVRANDGLARASWQKEHRQVSTGTPHAAPVPRKVTLTGELRRASWRRFDVAGQPRFEPRVRLGWGERNRTGNP